MSTRLSTGRVRSAYAFIKAHSGQDPVDVMCRVLEVAPSGYYAWSQQPLSNRAREDARLLRLIRASFIASHGVYGAPRVFLDLREAGEGLLQGWLTSHVWGNPTGKDGCHAQEVPTGVQS
jgi:putative transposase